MSSRSRALSLAPLCLAFACTSAENTASGDIAEAVAKAEATPATQTPEPEPEKVGTEIEVAKEPTPAPAEGIALEATQPSAPEEAPETGYPDAFFAYPAPVAASALPTHVPEWTLVQSFPGTVELADLNSGVLAFVDGTPYEMNDEGKLVENQGIATASMRAFDDAGPIFGDWPKDAWRIAHVSDGRADYYSTFFRWRGSRWVPQSYEGEQRVSSEFLLFEKGTRGGMLFAEAEGSAVTFTRLAGGGEGPGEVEVWSGHVRRAFETKGRSVFLMIDDESADGRDVLRIQRTCRKKDAAPDCPRLNTVTMPLPEPEYFSRWELNHIVPRHRHSLSAVMTERRRGNDDTGDTDVHTYVTHYEAGGWKLEAAPDDRAIAHLLASEDGGLWMVPSSSGSAAIWHRADDGKWVSVGLPDTLREGQRVHIARVDDERVWVSGVGSEGSWIYETRAATQSPPPEPDTAAG